MKRLHPTFQSAGALALLLLASCAVGSVARNAAPGANSGEAPVANRAEAAAQLSQEQGTIERVDSPLPAPEGFVNDYANVLDGKSERRLEAALNELREKSGIEFAVVTVETTGARSLSDYSLAVAKGWGVGPRAPSKGGGLLLLVAVKDRGWRLQVSNGLMTDLPDALTKELSGQSTDLYRQNKYAEGIADYVRRIIVKLEEARGFKLSARP